MAVGQGFFSEATQAAISAQAATTGTPPPTPAEPVSTTEIPAATTPTGVAPLNVEEAKSAPGEPVVIETPAPEEAPKEPADQPKAVDPDKALADAGFKPEDIGKELAENNGKVKPETIAALKEKFDPASVDAEIAKVEKEWAEKLPAEQAKLKAADSKVTEMNNFIFGALAAGDAAKGQENFNVLSAWAKANMAKEDLATVNALLRSGDQIAVKRGLEMAVTKWKGREKPMMTGDAQAAAAAAVAPEFVPLSKDEFINIMKTEKYQKDDAYAQEIDTRRRKTIAKGGYMTPEFSHLRPPI
jgi:hypothetical protein